MHAYISEYVRCIRVLAWNEREERPRSLLRVWIFLTLYTSLFVSLPLLYPSSEGGLHRTATLWIFLVCGTGVLLAVSARYLDKRPIRWFGFQIDRRWIADGLIGFGIGGILPAAAVTLGYLGGWVTIDETVYVPTVTYIRELGLALIVTVSIAVVEESVFRGYVLTNAIEGLNFSWLSRSGRISIAWGVSALLFACAHPSPTLVSRLHFLSVGFMLGLSYLLSGQLGLPIGIHAGFNFISAYVFSTAADPTVAVLSFTVGGPTWLTGQTGVIQTGLLLPAALLMITYLWWRTGSLSISPETTSKANDG